MAGGAEQSQHLDEAAVQRDGDDVGARNHDVLDLHLVQAEHILQHGALLRRDVDFGRRIGERILDVVADRGAAEAEQRRAGDRTGRALAAPARSDPASPAAGLSRSLMVVVTLAGARMARVRIRDPEPREDGALQRLHLLGVGVDFVIDSRSRCRKPWTIRCAT